MDNTNGQQPHAFQTNASDRRDFGDSIALVRFKVRVRQKVQNAFLDCDYYPVKVMTGHCVGTVADVTRMGHNFHYIWQIIWLLLAPLIELMSPRIR
jgi:hypothetical protein